MAPNQWDNVGTPNPAYEDDERRTPPPPYSTKEKSSNGTDQHETFRSDDPSYVRKRKLEIWRNLIVICIGFLFLFTAFQALSNIQSSLNSNEGLGTASLSTIYGALVVSCMFVPTVLIRKLGCKWTLVISVCMYSTYMAANFYATWGTLIPTAILVGFGAAPLWGSKCTYLTEMGQEYGEMVNENPEVYIMKFFGIFFMFFQSAQIWGNLISSLVLTKESDIDISQEQIDHCGATYCNEDFATWSNSSDSANKADDDQVYVLCGIYLGCSIIAAIIISVFLTPLKRTPNAQTGVTGFRLLIATFRHMRNPKQLLLIPLTIFSGIEQSFLAGDFTKAFVNCTQGIHYVGYVMICYGVVDALCSFGFGQILKYVGRPALYGFGATINIALAITMLIWKPQSDTFIVLYVIAGLWGMADAIWQTQINSFYGVLFTDNTEAAFSNYRLWESVGFILGFAWSSLFCINVKLYILLGFLTVGILGYSIIEITMRFGRRDSLKVSDSVK